MSAVSNQYPVTLSREEAARFLGISVRLLDSLVRAGEVPSRKISGRRIFVRSKLIEWLEAEEGA